MKTRIAVLVSGGGTNLQALINAQHKGIIENGSIELVVSNKKDAYALERAKKADIPGIYLSKKKLGGQEGFEAELQKLLEEYHIDLVVLAGFLSILTEGFTGKWPKRIINIHPALIPSFCGKGYYGLKVHEEALKYGVKVTGATVHFVNEVPDGGQIIMQKAVYIREDDTPETLQKRVMRLAEWQILPKSVEMVSKSIVLEKEKEATK